MSIELYDFAMREALDPAEVADFLWLFFKRRFTAMIPETDYWDLTLEDMKTMLAVGTDRFDAGYRTFVKLQGFFVYSEPRYACLAQSIALRFETETAIPDFRQRVIPGCYLVFYPDGRVAEAVDVSTGGVNELDVVREIPWNPGAGAAEPEAGE